MSEFKSFDLGPNCTTQPPPTDDEPSTADPHQSDETPADISWFADHFLPPAEPAPKMQTRNKSMLTEALVHLLASLVVELCVEFAGRSFTVRELWDRVPAPKPQYKSLNGVGDFLGHGKGERSLKLWKGANGPLACRENAIIAAHRLEPGEIQKLANRLKLTEPSTLCEMIRKLPSVTQCTDR
jgi:hypothetical protein